MIAVQTNNTPTCSLEVKKQWCKGCHLCVNACPKDVLSLDVLGKVLVKKPESCIGCGLCEATCPDYVIRVIRNA